MVFSTHSFLLMISISIRLCKSFRLTAEIFDNNLSSSGQFPECIVWQYKLEPLLLQAWNQLLLQSPQIPISGKYAGAKNKKYE